MENIEVGKRYKSKVNSIAVGCEYEVVKKNKTTCWVKLWEDGTPTKTIYKNIRYSILCNKDVMTVFIYGISMAKL